MVSSWVVGWWEEDRTLAYIWGRSIIGPLKFSKGICPSWVRVSGGSAETFGEGNVEVYLLGSSLVTTGRNRSAESFVGSGLAVLGEEAEASNPA